MDRSRNLASTLATQNKSLQERIEQISKQVSESSEIIDKHKAICGAVAHSLKGEFMNIGNSMQELRELAALRY